MGLGSCPCCGAVARRIEQRFTLARSLFFTYAEASCSLSISYAFRRILRPRSSLAATPPSLRAGSLKSSGVAPTKCLAAGAGKVLAKHAVATTPQAEIRGLYSVSRRQDCREAGFARRRGLETLTKQYPPAVPSRAPLYAGARPEMARKTPEYQSVTARPERSMRDLLKELNDRNPCDLTALNEHELRRLEALCESWARLAEAEAGRRK
jgi:hypothetical protein